MMNENFGANDLKDLEFSDSDFFYLRQKWDIRQPDKQEFRR